MEALLSAELEALPGLRGEQLLAGAPRLSDLARGRSGARADFEVLARWFAATSVALEPPSKAPRRPRPSAAFLETLAEAARHALRLGDEKLFSVLIEELETEVDRAHRAGAISTTEADDWEDRAYVLLGWLARRTGATDQVQEVLAAFSAPAPVTRSLTAERWILHFQAMAAADAGDLATARRLLRRACRGLAWPCVVVEVELIFDAADIDAWTGNALAAAEALVETALYAQLFWPPSTVVGNGLRGAELLAVHGRHERARAAVDHLQAVASAADAPRFLATRAELCARAGSLHAASAIYGQLRSSEPRGSELSVRAALGLARVAATEGLLLEARGWLQAIDEDLAVLSADNPRRQGLEAALQATEGDDLAESLADADAWLTASRDAPALPFRRPFPGAVALGGSAAIDTEVN